jgi:thiamine-phosphate pyrophosphorylase
MPRKLQLYYITDRAQIRSGSLDLAIERAIQAGVDWVQIREKDLPPRTLLTITKAAVERVEAVGSGHTHVIVNDRIDVALAAKAHGVNLGMHSIPAQVVRRVTPPGFQIGVSCHSLADALAAQAAGADYILLGPVFQTPSKARYGPPLGLDKLREVTTQVSIPVFALGGISIDRIRVCSENGAAGIAGIRLFQDCDCLEDQVREMRAQLAAGI